MQPVRIIIYIAFFDIKSLKQATLKLLLRTKRRSDKNKKPRCNAPGLKVTNKLECYFIGETFSIIKPFADTASSALAWPGS